LPREKEAAMLPYADDPKPKATTFPFITILLFIINIAVFVYQVSLGSEGVQDFVMRWGFIPAEFWDGNQFITLITAMFLHGGLLHIASNMLFLAIFGNNVEDQLGHWTYLGVYLAAGIVASLAFAAAFPGMDGPLVGASGAIAGVLGGYILLFPRATVRALFFFGPFITAGRVAAILLIGFWFLLQVFQSFVQVLELAPQENVAFLAHAAGFVFGLIATGAIRERRDQQISHWEQGGHWWNRSFRNWVLLAIATVMMITTAQFVGGLLGTLMQAGVLLLIAAIALFDGIARLRGRAGLLGSTQRASRAVAIVQIGAAILLIGGIFVT
jgi:membrane associated rhomboid family serine protease